MLQSVLVDETHGALLAVLVLVGGECPDFLLYSKGVLGLGEGWG